RLVLPGVDRELQHRVAEAPEAGAVQPRPEAQVEHRAGRGLGDHELRRHLLRHGQVALTAELEGLQLELDLVAVLLARPELDGPETEAPHRAQGNVSGGVDST